MTYRTEGPMFSEDLINKLQTEYSYINNHIKDIQQDDNGFADYMISFNHMPLDDQIRSAYPFDEYGNDLDKLKKYMKIIENEYNDNPCFKQLKKEYEIISSLFELMFI